MRNALLALVFSVTCAGAARQPFSAGDLWNWRAAGDPQISPGGQWVVYVESWRDRAADAARSSLVAVSVDGKQRLRLTDGGGRDWSPRWSPDGARIAWIGERGGATSIYAGPVKTGGQRLVIERPALRLAWSPEGAWIAFTLREQAQTAPPGWAPPAILPRLWPGAPSYVRLYVVPATGGAARPLTSGDFDAMGEPAWMPDGQSILTAAADGAIYAVRVADGARRRLTAGAGRNEAPVPSPDGSQIAFLTTDSRPRSYAIRKLAVMNADGGRVRVLAGALDRDVTGPQWSSDSRTVYFIADDRGSTHIYAAHRDGSVRVVTGAAERLRGFSLAANGSAATVRSTWSHTPEVITQAVDVPSAPAVLASPNATWFAEREAGAVEEIAVPSGGKTIQAWVVKPPGFDAAKKYPLLLDIRDAPRRMYGAEFSLRAQILAAQGWVVLRVNPRGTPGYGEEFGRLLPGAVPGDDADDLLAAVDLLAAKSYIDPHRMALCGGLLAAWIIGHTDRFAAAVVRHPIADWTLDVAAAPDGARRAAAWLGAMPWEDPDRYSRHSPIYFAQNFKTPALVLAGDPDPQADELYFALEARKVESALVRVHAEGKPAEKALELETVLAWLRRFLAQ